MRYRKIFNVLLVTACLFGANVFGMKRSKRMQFKVPEGEDNPQLLVQVYPKLTIKRCELHKGEFWLAPESKTATGYCSHTSRMQSNRSAVPPDHGHNPGKGKVCKSPGGATSKISTPTRENNDEKV